MPTTTGPTSSTSETTPKPAGRAEPSRRAVPRPDGRARRAPARPGGRTGPAQPDQLAFLAAGRWDPRGDAHPAFGAPAGLVQPTPPTSRGASRAAGPSRPSRVELAPPPRRSGGAGHAGGVELADAGDGRAHLERLRCGQRLPSV